MLSQQTTKPGVMDELATYESTQEWGGIFKVASLLSDSESFYADQDNMFGNSDYGFPPIEEMPPKLIKTEPVDLLPSDFQQFNAWQSKYIDYWQPQDCLFWLIHELQELKVAQGLAEVKKIDRFANLDGIALKNMTIDHFLWMFPEFGHELYNRLQRLKSSVNNFFSFDQWNNPVALTEESFVRYPTPSQESPMLTDLDSEPHLSTYTKEQPSFCSSTGTTGAEGEGDNGYKSDSSEETTPEPPQVPEKRRPGRPRGSRKKKKPEKLGRLWEFIRDLLLNPLYNPSLICWENYEEGTFRFVHSDRVAKLWGSKKDNTDMNYEKLSRAMRYYYKSQVLLPVYGKRLVYKFGPTATGWRSERPIFRQG